MTKKGRTEKEHPAKPLKISRIVRMISFENEAEIPRPKLSCFLLQPISEKISALDFIIEDAANKQIVFVQTTTLLPHTHEKKNTKIEKLFTSGKITRILDTIFQAKTTATIDNTSGTFIITLPESFSDWQVKILYVTSQHDTDVKAKSFWKWKDVFVAGRETLQPLNLLFHEKDNKKDKSVDPKFQVKQSFL